MRRGDRRTIDVDGKKIDGEFLGKGKFAKAYRNADDVYLFVTGDYSKEMIDGMNGNPHIPKCERVGYVDENYRTPEPTYVYKMPYYEPLAPHHAVAWQQFRELQRAHEEARTEVFSKHSEKFGQRNARLSILGYDVSQRTAELANVPETLKEALSDMADAGANYGSGVTFEFAKRNLGVDKDGNLVLRDILFDAEKLELERAKLSMQHRNSYSI